MFNQKEWMKQWRKDNQEKIKKCRKRYYEKNKEKEKKQANQWYKDNLEKCRENRKQYYKINCEKFKEYSRQWYQNNFEKAKGYQKQNRGHRTELQIQWRKDNPEKSKQYNKNGSERIKKWVKDNPEYYTKRWEKNKKDLKYILNHKIGNAIRKSLKGNKAGRHWETLVEYNLKDLMKRLKQTIPKGYNWNDYINGRLQIDHIIPIDIFNFIKPEHTDFKRCWALKNLRLLPARENQEKSNKLIKPFQLALKV